ncbi:hypothetical protein ACIBXA_06715 [Micromonospora echinaurantiaca]|uniref:zinc finger domain-containing protein n=1 Tax=Micromonospora TaxID=1873 RepID=UPI000D6EED1A|nr:hypothetical protein [Micromonospora sp. S4605]PWU47972.1 hypothetical protein DLJ47_29225 [Micromonospora sp. S4605]
MAEPVEERAKDALRDVHRAATRHRDRGLHRTALEISHMARELGHDPGPIEDWRPCPVCGAEPGASCIQVPGHDMVGGAHPERTRE